MSCVVHGITNAPRSDGFGAQAQAVFFTFLYARAHNVPFVYTPLAEMEHNYDNDPEFMTRMERLLGFARQRWSRMADFLKPLNGTVDRPTVIFVTPNLEKLLKSSIGEELRRIVLAGVERPAAYADRSVHHVAVHIRRPNPHDMRLDGANTNIDEYIRGLRHMFNADILSGPKQLHVYTQRTFEDADAIRDAFDDVKFHIDTPIEECFYGFVFADAFLMSRSAFSVSAAMLRTQHTYYLSSAVPHNSVGRFSGWEMI